MAASAPALIVVNFGSAALVESNVRGSIGSLEGIRVIVVDNFSSAGEQQRVLDLGKRRGWSIVLSERNEGFGRGVNLGVARAREEGASAFVLLNPDARLEPEGLRSLVADVSEHPMDLVAPVVVRPDGSVFGDLQDLYLSDGRSRSARGRPPGTNEADLMQWVSGACLAVSATLWDLVGGFDDEYFLYWEDVDLSVRVQRAGGAVRTRSDIVAVHDEGATHRVTSLGRAKSPIYYYFNIRNRMMFATKNLDSAAIARWDESSARLMWRVLMQGGRLQLIRPLRSLAPALRALAASRRIARDTPRTGGRPRPERR
ncbi:MAG: glycosyltransferase family 2 protein [Micrococcales bacterium]|nr:glycosyltransferase family 2 protein [Micrococcales bacterium]